MRHILGHLLGSVLDRHVGVLWVVDCRGVLVVLWLAEVDRVGTVYVLGVLVVCRVGLGLGVGVDYVVGVEGVVVEGVGLWSAGVKGLG